MSGIQATRAAAMLERELGLQAELERGRYGEFTVLVDDQPVLRGGALTFLGIMPSLRRVRGAIERALKPESPANEQKDTDRQEAT